jgi:phage gpG-like protein
VAARATFTIDEKADGWKRLQALLRSMRQGESYVKAGVTGQAATEQHDDEDGAAPLTNVDLAVIHEFGTATIPPRPFINGTFILHRDEYIRRLRELLPKVYEGRTTIPVMLEIVGMQMARDMRNRMVDGAGIPPPLAESTIARKRASGAWNKRGKAANVDPRPLVDTGRLRNSITHEVVLSGGSGAGGK